MSKDEKESRIDREKIITYFISFLVFLFFILAFSYTVISSLQAILE